jgi:hypothetical protein
MNKQEISVVKQRLKDLIEIAAQQPSKEEKDQLLDEIVEKALSGTSIDDIEILTAKHRKNVQPVQTIIKSSPVLRRVEVLKPSGEKLADSAPSTTASSTASSSESTETDQNGKKSRGRPRTKPKPKYDPKYAVMNLVDAFEIKEDGVRNALFKMIMAARANSDGGRGIPQTEEPDNFRFLRRGGPVPQTHTFLIDGVQYDVVPPIISKGSGGVANSIWMEFENILNGIEEMEMTKEDELRRQHEVAESKSLQNIGMVWYEGVTPDVLKNHAVPAINAATARTILAKIPEFKKRPDDFLEMAPAVWLSPGGQWTDEFSALIRDVYLGKVQGFGRKERIALARLLIEPLGSIEFKLFQIAFPERYKAQAEDIAG